MKKTCLKVLAKVAKKSVKQANNAASSFWSYQPKAPKCAKKIK